MFIEWHRTRSKIIDSRNMDDQKRQMIQVKREKNDETIDGRTEEHRWRKPDKRKGKIALEQMDGKN